MTFSLTSFFSGLCSVTLFIMCFGFILRHKKAYKYFRTDALLLIICLIFIRLLFPFEHKHMIYIPIQKVMNPLLDFFNQTYIVKLLILLWLMGSVIFLIYFIKDYIHTEYIYKKIIKQSQIVRYRQSYPVYKSEFVERFPELSLFYRLFSPLNSEMICIFPYFCPYAESAREIREIFVALHINNWFSEPILI